MDAPVHTEQQSLLNLEAAWLRHFDSLKKLKRGEIKPDDVIGPPQYKKKHQCRDSFRYPDPKQFRLDQANSRMLLPKLGWVRYRNSCKVEGKLSNITVSRQGSKWFASIQTEREVEEPIHP